jgi:hypothetical protein
LLAPAPSNTTCGRFADVSAISSAAETSPGPVALMARPSAGRALFEAWWETLNEEVQEAIDAAVELLEERGPALGRPLADNMHQSRHPNMKELRPASSTRVLFAFDPRRVAILLIGGHKRGSWNRWYDEMVPIADALYDEHLAGVGEPKERRG